MRGEPYACLGGVEIVNGARTLAYLEHLSLPSFSISREACDCSDLYKETCYLILDGSGDYVTTPDNASLDILGDIDIRAAVALTDWTSASYQVLVAKWTPALNLSYVLELEAASGKLIMGWSADGANPLAAVSSVAPTVDDGDFLAVRATLDVNNGAAGRTVQFFTKTVNPLTALEDIEDDFGWTQLGSDQISAGVTSIFSGTGIGVVGALGDGTLPMAGKVLAAVVKNGIEGTTVTNPDFTAQETGTSSFADGSGRTWTLQGGANIFCVSPTPDEELNPAPWFDSTRPESEEFLGVFALPAFPTSIRRDVSEIVAGGGVVGPMRPRSRVVPFEGSMYATTARGMAYGERWLQDVLQGQACIDDCGQDSLEIAPVCTGDPFRVALNAGVIDGPIFSEPIGRGCVVQEVAFQLAAGNPYLFSRPTTVVEASLTTSDSETVVIDTSEWSRKVVRLTVESTDGAGGPITVTATPLAPGDDCGDAGSLNPCATFVVNAEFGASIIIDSRNHSANVYRRQTEEVESALGHLEFEGPFPWLELEPCSQICLEIASGPAATIKVETFTKEV